VKSYELFDILGEIDDKYFEEAKQPDAQHGEVIVAESSPFRSFISIFMPIAACVAVVAAVVIGADLIGKNAGFVGPNDSGSTSDISLSSESSTVSEPESNVSSSSSSVSGHESNNSVASEDKGLIDLDEYPWINSVTVPDIKGGGLETQMEFQDKKLQKAKLTSISIDENYELYLLGEFLNIDSSDDPNRLYSYYVEIALVKNGKVVDFIAPYVETVSMGQGGFQLINNELYSYLDYYQLDGGKLVIFKYREPGDEDFTCTFFTITEDDKLMYIMGDKSAVGGYSSNMNTTLSPGFTVNEKLNTLTDGDIVYKFDCSKFGLDPHSNAQYTASRIADLSDYPMLDMSQVPDVAEITDFDQCLPKAKFAEKQVGEYTLTLVGEYIRSPKQVNPDTILAEDIRTIISHNGKIIPSECDVRSGELDINNFDGEFMTAYEMKDGVVFELPERSPGDNRFGMIVNDVMTDVTGDYSATAGVEPPEGYELRGAEPVVLPEENALILNNVIKYSFDFNTNSVTTSFTEAELSDLSDYKTYDKNTTNIQPKVILETSSTADYNFYLLGENVENQSDPNGETWDTITHFSFTRLIVAAERNGKIVAHIEALASDPYIYEIGLIGKFLRPFEMKDGTGFVMYCNLSTELDQNLYYAYIYKIENDEITQLKYEYDFAPASAFGTPRYVGDNFEIDRENNAIISDKVTITIDFNNNTFSES